jgi:hypothetical protein
MGNTYGLPRPVTGLFYMDMMFAPHRKHLRDSAACYKNSFTFCVMKKFDCVAVGGEFNSIIFNPGSGQPQAPAASSPGESAPAAH